MRSARVSAPPEANCQLNTAAPTPQRLQRFADYLAPELKSAIKWNDDIFGGMRAATITVTMARDLEGSMRGADTMPSFVDDIAARLQAKFPHTEVTAAQKRFVAGRWQVTFIARESVKPMSFADL